MRIYAVSVESVFARRRANGWRKRGVAGERDD